MRRFSLRRARSSFSSVLSASSNPLAGGRDGAANTETASDEQRFYKDLDEIKRYEDFTTIDWVQDAAREQLRRRARKYEKAKASGRRGGWDLRQRIWELYDAGQAWIVVTLVGAAIGLNAAFLNIVTEWLSDIKRGHCTTAFYLNENFCCWGAENGCEEWHRWSGLWPVNYFLYFIFSIVFAFISAVLVKSFAPYAAGSGISEIKCIIAGFVMKGFLGFWTLLVKSIALPLAIASGLSVGKEGPSVHYAVCTGNVISRWFTKYKRNAGKTREILSACAAAGVAVAFGSPVGGVLFSLEEMSSYFPLKTMWRSYFCALVATAVLAAMNPFRTGQLVMFEVHYDRSWHLFELIFFVFLGAFGGLYGAFVIKWNLRAQAFRKKFLTKYAIPEVLFLTAVTALLCYPNMFLRIDMTENMEILFLECEGTHDYDGLCDSKNRLSMVFSLAIATVLRTALVIISYGCKVPAGIFVPSMAIGASFGRMVGILVQALHEAFPKSRFFAACGPDLPCITPGTYAFLGAGAALSGIMHITVSVVVIMFELTGALTYILPTMIVVGTTKAISAYFPPGGIADRMIAFNGFPFLDSKEEHTFHVPVSTPMTPVASLSTLPASGLKLSTLETTLNKTSYSGFPIVSDASSRLVLGYIGRRELQYALAKAKKSQMLHSDTQCIFSTDHTTSNANGATSKAQPLVSDNSLPPAAGPSNTTSTTQHVPPAQTFDSIASTHLLEFIPFVNPTPITVQPHLPLETVLQIFQKMGPRVILVEHKGRLAGLITIKDCLKYQWRIEHGERHGAGERNGEGGGSLERREKWLWDVIEGAGATIARVTDRWTGGRIRLGESRDGEGRRWSGEQRGLLVGESVDPRDSRGGILDRTEDDDENDGEEGSARADEPNNGVELRERT